MQDDSANILAMRARAKQLVVVTTGVQSLASDANGYVRTTGSFITDGFARGMELTPTGFTQATPGLVDYVSALTMTIRGGRTVAGAAGGRSLVVGLPSIRFFEGVEAEEAGVIIKEPLAERWFVEEEYVPGAAPRQVTGGPFGQLECDFSYFLKLYSWEGMGFAAPFKVARALLNLYPPRDEIPLANGDVLRVNHSPAPRRTQLLSAEQGWAVISCEIPVRYRTANSV